MSVADTADWTRPITVLSGGSLTSDTADWTIPVIVESGSAGGGGGFTDPTLPTGAIAQTVDRYTAGGSDVRPVNATLYMTLIWIPGGVTIHSITFMSGSVGSSSPSHQWFGLYDVSLNQLALTTDDTTTAWNSATRKTLNIAQTAAGASSSYAVGTGAAYYLGLMVTDPASMSFLGRGQVQANIAGFAPMVAGTSDTGQSTRPAFPHTGIALVGPSGGLWGYVS